LRRHASKEAWDGYPLARKRLPSSVVKTRVRNPVFLTGDWHSNPHIRYYEGDRRGYFAATVTADEMRLDLRFVTSVEDSTAVGYTERSFTVRDGEPGAQVG
jgi:alkaline phosphatase D